MGVFGDFIANSIPYVDSDTDRELAAQESLRASEQPIIGEEEVVEPEDPAIPSMAIPQEEPDEQATPGDGYRTLPGDPKVTGRPEPMPGIGTPDPGNLQQLGAGVVQEPAQPKRVPGPTQAIQPPAEKPAQSIKEYIALMRSQGQAPRFTNIANDPNQAQVEGQVDGSWYVPEKGRVIANGPGGVKEYGKMDVGGIMKGSEGGYDPTTDPFQGATDLAMKDAPQLWDMITGGGVPMDQATPDQYKKMSAMLMQVRDNYLGVASKRREDYIRLVAAGYNPDEVRKILIGGESVAGLRKTNTPPREMSADQIAKWMQTEMNNERTAHSKAFEADPRIGPFNEAASWKRVQSRFGQVAEAIAIMAKQGKGGGGVAQNDEDQEEAIPSTPPGGKKKQPGTPMPEVGGQQATPGQKPGGTFLKPSGSGNPNSPDPRKRDPGTPPPLRPGEKAEEPKKVIPEAPVEKTKEQKVQANSNNREKVKKYIDSIGDPQKRTRALVALKEIQSMTKSGATVEEINAMMVNKHPEILEDLSIL